MAVLFSSDSCYIFPENPFQNQELIQDFMIGKGNLQRNLYVLDASHPSRNVSSSTPITALSVLSISSEVWHQRLGHPSFSKIQALSKTLHLSSCKNDSHCKICPLAKQKRMSFPSNPHLSKLPFDLIHIDV